MQIRKVAADFHCTETTLKKTRRYQGKEVVEWISRVVRIGVEGVLFPMGKVIRGKI